jgi:hypothetical protein
MSLLGNAMNTLELASTKELIEELMSRSTFAGLVLCSEDEQRVPGQVHSNFRMYVNVTPDEALQILEKTVVALKD